jgi:hypothetical protein
MSGVDLPSVQRLMGHKNIQNTMIYAHLAPEHLEAAFANLDGHYVGTEAYGKGQQRARIHRRVHRDRREEMKNN